MITTTTIRIGSRGSKLALWQANYTIAQLKELGIPTELKIIKTKGDIIQHLSFDKIEGKGFFTKEIEDELLAGNIDLAVHSMKDLPTQSPEGLVITAVSYRENPADLLLIHPDAVAEDQILKFKKGAVVGTSSARRKSQIRDIRNDIEIKDIRGNVPTRIDKLRKGDYDAILLAAAGVQRLELDLSDLKVIPLHPKEFIPAPAQGVLAFQTRADDLATRRILKKIHNPDVAEVTNIERKVLNLFDGGCHLPLGVYCEKDATGNFHVWAAKAESWDGEVKRVRLSSSTKFEL
ncbi:MAG: hydroxymethylbilane synthase, partial [Saprospiraceae bacterium]